MPKRDERRAGEAEGVRGAEVGRAAGAALEAELKELVKARIGKWKYPRWIEFTTELPKTATGKIQRFKLKED